MIDFGYFNRDCMEGMKEIPDKFFDLALCDPPYGIGCMSMNYTTSGAVRTHGYAAADRRDYRKQSQWDVKPTKQYFNELFRVSKRQIVWGGELLFRFLAAIQKLRRLGQTCAKRNDKRFCRL